MNGWGHSEAHVEHAATAESGQTAKRDGKQRYVSETTLIKLVLFTEVRETRA
jgi:hypothetical protein